MFVQESNAFLRVHFHTFMNFLGTNQLITNDPSPKHYATTTLLSSDSKATIAAIGYPTFTQPIGPIKHCSTVACK